MTDEIRVGTNDTLRVSEAVCVDDAEVLFAESAPTENRRLSDF